MAKLKNKQYSAAEKRAFAAGCRCGGSKAKKAYGGTCKNKKGGSKH